MTDHLDGIPSVLSLKQAEAALGVPVPDLRNWIRSSDLITIQLTAGGKRYVPRSEIERIAELIMLPGGPDWLAALNAE